MNMFSDDTEEDNELALAYYNTTYCKPGRIRIQFLVRDSCGTQAIMFEILQIPGKSFHQLRP